MKQIFALITGVILLAGCGSDTEVAKTTTQEVSNFKHRITLSYMNASNGHRGPTYIVNKEGQVVKLDSQTGTYAPKVETIETNETIKDGYLALSQDGGDELHNSGLCVGFIRKGEFSLVEMNCSMANLVNLYWLTGGKKIDTRAVLPKNPIDFFEYDDLGYLNDLTQLVGDYFVALDKVNAKEELKQDTENVQSELMKALIFTLSRGTSIESEWVYKKLYSLSRYKFEPIESEVMVDPKHLMLKVTDVSENHPDELAYYLHYVPWINVFEVYENGVLKEVTSGGLIAGFSDEATQVGFKGFFSKYETRLLELVVN